MENLISLLAGGALGAVLRFGMTTWLSPYHQTYPIGTFSVNLAGSLLIGIIAGAVNLDSLSPPIKAFLVIGLLGSFTTFSTYTLESFNLWKAGAVKMALFYLVASNLLGLLLVALGFWFGNLFRNG